MAWAKRLADVTKMAEFYRGQRSWRKGKPNRVPGLEKFRVGDKARRTGRSHRY